MSRFLIALSLLLFAVTAYSEDSPDPMHEFLTQERATSCIDYAHNAEIIIPRLHGEGKLDSLEQVLAFLEEKCGSRWELESLRILLSIEAGTFTEDVYDSTIIGDRIAYAPWRRYVYRSCFPDDYFYMVRYDKLNLFMRGLASRLLKVVPPENVEYLWLHLFLDNEDYVFDQLKTSKYAGSDLWAYYQRFVHRAWDQVGRRGSQYIMSAGVWSPRDKLRLLGDQPEITFSWSRKQDNMQYDLTMSGRFGKAASKYVAENKQGVIDTTDHFSSLYFGFDVGRELFHAGRNSLEMVGGIGYDYINTVMNDDDKREPCETLNLNAGARYRIYLGRYHTKFIGLQVRYSFLNYDNEHGTDFSGDAVSLALVFGLFPQSQTVEMLKSLRQ